jgi:hypothetical protein
MRFSILTLLGLVAVAATGTAALLNANDFWAKASYSIGFVTLLVAVIAGLTLRDGARAFWVGFAVSELRSLVTSYSIKQTCSHQPSVITSFNE